MRFKTKFRIDSILILSPLTLLIALIGCQTKQREETKQMSIKEQVLRLNNHGDFASLNPQTGIDLHCRNMQKALFEGLTRISADGEPELAGAKKIEISPSKLHYTITLREMKWTNGEPVTASHFERAWKAALSPNSNCLRSDLFYCIKNARQVKSGEVPPDQLGVKALDPQTLVVELEHPTPYFLDLLANPLFSPLYDQSEFPTVFNGPFRLANWEHDRRLVLEKNPDYWDAETVQLNRIESYLISDPNTAFMMYEKGEIDWVGHPFTLLPQDSIEKVQEFKDFNAKPIAGVFWLCLNTDVFPLNSIKIRQALSTVINREAISKHVVLGEVPSKSLIPPTMPFSHEEKIYKDGDERTAKKLFEEGLAELHLTREEFPILHYSYCDVPGQKKLAETIQQTWEQTFGIQVELTCSEWNVFFASLGDRQYQIGGCIWFAVFNDPIYFLEFFKEKTHRYNASSWENKYYQQLLDLSDTEPDPTIRLEHLKQAELLILSEMPVIPLYVTNAKYLKSPKVKGLVINNLGQADFKWTYLEEINEVKELITH